MIEKWLQKHTERLEGKTVALTGATGGIGKELCFYLARLGASLILLDRNPQKSTALRDELIRTYGVRVTCIHVDLEKPDTVYKAISTLQQVPVDVFIHNAGAYSIPRHTCETGFDNVFQINFVSPYYMIRKLLPLLRQRQGRVVIVGSIAHTYSKTDCTDVDFSSRRQASKVYGNAKRFLMYSLYELFRNEPSVSLAVTHPGITFTNITAHYPPVVFAVIKYPMKILFMKPRKAALCVLYGLFCSCRYHEWIGPRLWNVWGLPTKQPLRTVSKDESQQIGNIADTIYQTLCNNTDDTDYSSKP